MIKQVLGDVDELVEGQVPEVPVGEPADGLGEEVVDVVAAFVVQFVQE